LTTSKSITQLIFDFNYYFSCKCAMVILRVFSGRSPHTPAYDKKGWFPCKDSQTAVPEDPSADTDVSADLIIPTPSGTDTDNGSEEAYTDSPTPGEAPAPE
ncbi:hypothetical protein, partial [Erwinia amylovora]|uniref:hypothetical protein n=1 Tax=Erwinia amylovora TaxID=552 RepID=UPI003D6FCC5D